MEKRKILGFNNSEVKLAIKIIVIMILCLITLPICELGLGITDKKNIFYWLIYLIQSISAFVAFFCGFLCMAAMLFAPFIWLARKEAK